MMFLLISGLSTLRALSLVDGVAGISITNWLASWATAFPVVLVVTPVVRRIVARAIVAPSTGT